MIDYPNCQAQVIIAPVIWVNVGSQTAVYENSIDAVRTKIKDTNK